MEIKARVSLSLPNTFYKITLHYDTYQKATYDSYLVASLIKNAETQEEAFEYIDEICGQGSLNVHFRNLYEEISKFSESQIDGILKNSLYPVTMKVIDHFKYYKMFDASRFKNKVFKGNLYDNQELLKEVMMPKSENATFLDIQFEDEPGAVKKDVYDAVFSEDKIMVNLDDNTFMPISKSEFDNVYEGQNMDISAYPGKVGEEITGGQWNALSQTIIDAISKDRFVYLNNDKNVVSIFNEYIKVTSVISVFGIYFFKETKYDFIKSNAKVIEEAIQQLIDNGWINEYKTKSLVRMLMVVSDDSAKSVVEYVLHRKDSKEIAEVGLMLVRNGYEKGWQKESLSTMKKFATPQHINYLYKLDNSLGFDINELLLVDKNILSEADAIKVKAYENERKNVLDQMDKMLGNIMNSGVRERMKSLKTKDSVYQQLNDFIKKKSAHLKLTKDYESMTLEQLTKEYELIKRMFEGPFQNIKARLEKEENKA